MTYKQANLTVGIIYIIAVLLILTGAFFRLQHYPNGPLISGIGSMLGTITVIYDIIRLRKKIHKLEKQLAQNA